MEEKDIKIIELQLKYAKKEKQVSNLFDVRIVEKLLQAYKRDEKVIHMMASYIKSPRVLFFGGRGHQFIIDYFRKKCE